MLAVGFDRKSGSLNAVRALAAAGCPIFPWDSRSELPCVA